MVPPPPPPSGDSNFFQDLVEAIADRHGQMDIRLDHLELRLPLIRESVELNGTISVSVHMRELSDREKQARVSKELRHLSK